MFGFGAWSGKNAERADAATKHALEIRRDDGTLLFAAERDGRIAGDFTKAEIREAGARLASLNPQEERYVQLHDAEGRLAVRVQAGEATFGPGFEGLLYGRAAWTTFAEATVGA